MTGEELDEQIDGCIAVLVPRPLMRLVRRVAMRVAPRVWSRVQAWANEPEPPEPKR